MMDRQLHVSLREAKRSLVKMGSFTEKAINQAVQSLATQNVSLAEWVIKEDKQINELELQIDDLVSKLIATQQPVAKDLRKLIAIMKISSDLERMADLACNVAQVTISFNEKQLSLYKELEDISEMARLTQQMVRDVIHSYLDGDQELAMEVSKLDDQVDKRYDLVIQEIIQFLHDNPKQAEVSLHLSFVARHLERIADHATNIAEHILYIETGDQADLN